MKNYGSPTIAAAILILLAVNLSATSTMQTALDDLLKTGLVEAAPQSATTSWADKSGIVHTIQTSRMPREGDESLASRHQETVRAFIEAFPTE